MPHVSTTEKNYFFGGTMILVISDHWSWSGRESPTLGLSKSVHLLMFRCLTYNDWRHLAPIKLIHYCTLNSLTLLIGRKRKVNFRNGPRDVITADYTIIMSRTLEVTSYLLPGQTLESFLHLLQCDHYNIFHLFNEWKSRSLTMVFQQIV